ncbi:[Fe-Fe] hydrogenase large subunit C-terminal domain-containing protein [Frisingicoccus sp.]|uniref:[Fe-Fe] hydrogenase large subunit C-terminal domain-containing protein n=1 Tax=Frisingicoccus sp. TaxID=1918627 RepID=UPI0015AAECD0
MNNHTFFHSVYLNEELCNGCINCIKRCPTQAIRVRNGKAVITSQFCIDCGECVRICAHHAKRSHYDRTDILSNYKYTVALPAPSLYSQFNNLNDINIVLTALIYMGFDDVFEVASAAEIVSEVSRAYIDEHPEKWPLISTACPSVVRLIRVRFPNLIDHLLPINPPVEVAARLARKYAVEKTGLAPEDIGIIFISPCPSKVAYAKEPLGTAKSDIDGVLAIKDVYPMLLPLMVEAEKKPMDLSRAGRIGVGWGSHGGEAAGIVTDNYLAADGIENVIRVLEDLEDEKFSNLSFIELNSCDGGCVGGVLTVENPYVAQAKLKKLNQHLPEVVTRAPSDLAEDEINWTEEVEYLPVFRLGTSMKESIMMMNRVERLCQKFPGLDCGACGAPTCKALAEDIVRGKANETYCIYILKDQIHSLTRSMNSLVNSASAYEMKGNDYRYIFKQYLRTLLSDISLLDAALNLNKEDKDV